MKLARREDKKIVVDIISSTFEDNPGVNWLLSKRGNRKKKIERMAAFVFAKALNRQGVFLSSNRKGVAVCYRFNCNKFSLSAFVLELWFAFSSMSLLRISKVLKREAYRKKMRPADGNYLYFWFLGVLPGGERAVHELKDGIFDLARKENLAIYMETAIERNKTAYERYGFKTYHYWYNEKENIRFWFMKWKPESNIK